MPQLLLVNSPNIPPWAIGPPDGYDSGPVNVLLQGLGEKVTQGTRFSLKFGPHPISDPWYTDSRSPSDCHP